MANNEVRLVEIDGTGFLSIRSQGGGRALVNPMMIQSVGMNELESVVIEMANGRLIGTLHTWEELEQVCYELGLSDVQDEDENRVS